MTDPNKRPDTAERAAQSARLRRLCEMMDEQIRNMTPQERDRNMQLFIAQAMTPSQKLRALCGMMDFVIAQRRRQDNTSPGKDEPRGATPRSQQPCEESNARQ